MIIFRRFYCGYRIVMISDFAFTGCLPVDPAALGGLMRYYHWKKDNILGKDNR